MTKTDQDKINKLLPLKPTDLHMLVALAEGDKHGYAIHKQVERDTDGQVKVRIGSLYNHLRNLLESTLIEESNQQDFEEGEARRRTYRITPFGRHVLAAEITRLRNVISTLDASGIFGDQPTQGTENAS